MLCLSFPDAAGSCVCLAKDFAVDPLSRDAVQYMLRRAAEAAGLPHAHLQGDTT
jgi:hypothetical protein